jgi:hypothetical protein
LLTLSFDHIPHDPVQQGRLALYSLFELDLE